MNFWVSNYHFLHILQQLHNDSMLFHNLRICLIHKIANFKHLNLLKLDDDWVLISYYTLQQLNYIELVKSIHIILSMFNSIQYKDIRQMLINHNLQHVYIHYNLNHQYILLIECHNQLIIILKEIHFLNNKFIETLPLFQSQRMPILNHIILILWL